MGNANPSCVRVSQVVRRFYQTIMAGCVLACLRFRSVAFSPVRPLISALGRLKYEDDAWRSWTATACSDREAEVLATTAAAAPQGGRGGEGASGNNCFKCGQPGHWSRDCTAARGGPAPPRDTTQWQPFRRPQPAEPPPSGIRAFFTVR